MSNKDKYTFYKIGEEDLPMPTADMRGQVRVKPHTVSEQGDRLMFCRMQDDGATIAWANLTGMTVQNLDVTVGFGIGVLDFGTGLVVTESPADEANIAVDLGSVRQNIVVPWSDAQSGSTTASTTSTAIYQEALHAQVPIPPEGTWRIDVIAGLQLKHSVAAGEFNYRILIDGTPSTVRANDSTIYSAVAMDGRKSGISGAGVGGIIHVFVEFKALTAGTVNARAPWMFAVASRAA